MCEEVHAIFVMLNELGNNINSAKKADLGMMGNMFKGMLPDIPPMNI